MQDDDGDLQRLMRRFGRTDLGAQDPDDSDVEQYVDGARLAAQPRPAVTRSCW